MDRPRVNWNDATPPPPPACTGLGVELRRMFGHMVEVWRLVPIPQKVALGGAALLMALTSASNTAVALFLGWMVDGVMAGLRREAAVESLYWLAASFLGLIAAAYVLREVLNVVRRYLVESTCTRINRDTTVRLIAHVMRGNLAQLSRDKVGALHGRMFRSIDGFVRFLRVSFLDFLPALLTGMFALAAAVGKQPFLGLVMVGVIPTALFLTVRQLLSQKDVRLRLMRDCEEIDGAVVEQLGGLEYIRAADTEALEVRRLEDAAEKRRAREVRHHFEMSLFGSAKALNEGLFHVLVLAFAIHLAINGQATAGDVLTFSVLFLNVVAPLAEVHRVLDEGHEASLRVADLIRMLADPVDRSYQVPSAPARASVAMAPAALARPGLPIIEFQDVVVEYLTPEGKHVRALDGVSLAIRHGETIGVAGRSGGGKSTWIKVVLRLTHPQAGSVRIGGVPLEEVSREAIRQLIGYVGQQPFVFAGTIAENIAYGMPQATRDEIRRAAEWANLHHEIMLLPGGYDAPVTERGQNLSGGQRQRLAIARVLLKPSPILILDEATSALDNISERRVQCALGVRDPNRTTILVAHRLTTLRDADRIFVFEDGRVVEVGPYQELVRRGGVFADLVASAENGIEGNRPVTIRPSENRWLTGHSAAST